MRSTLALVLTVFLAIGGSGMTFASGDIPRPPQFGPTPESTPADTPEAASGDASCEAIPAYYRELNRALMHADVFNTFLSDGAHYEDLTERTAKPILKDIDTLVETLEGLDVPEVYADGNQGIVLLMGFFGDQVSFYGLDSTKVPKPADFDAAWQHIYDGETAAADACPSEIADVGGYIFYDPADLEDDYKH